MMQNRPLISLLTFSIYTLLSVQKQPTVRTEEIWLLASTFRHACANSGYCKYHIIAIAFQIAHHIVCLLKLTGKQRDRKQLQHASYTTAHLKWTLTICRAGHSKELKAFHSSDQTVKQSTVFLRLFPKQAVPLRLSLQNLDIQYKITHSFKLITLLFVPTDP